MTRRALAVAALVVVLAACRHDGRDMRAPVYPAPAPTTTTTTVAPLASG